MALIASASAAALPAILDPGAHAARATGAAYTSSTLHFAVHVGPGGSQACDVVGEIFSPAGASGADPVPAILTTNGFGGSYTDQVPMAQYFASNGYAVLTYSGLGFGGSGCKITLDDPLFDGEAASQLVSYLGGAPGIAYLDSGHTQAAPTVDYVVRDGTNHDDQSGAADPFDPRVGMIGGSYGGEIQFAAAYVDPRIDTIVPMITWNDLNYSLAPNNAGLSPTSDATTPPVPGAAKSTWALGFSAEGMADGITGAQSDPSRDIGCPNFANWVCPGLASAASTGYPDRATRLALEHASVASYISHLDIPTLLMQGENDTLFNLDEAVANFESLQARHVPVNMVWQSWGHSGSNPAPGELDLNNPDPATQYETMRVADWFAHYLRDDSSAPTGPTFAYFRDWVSYHGIATPAYATSGSYPVGHSTALYLSAGRQLVTGAHSIGASSQSFATPPAGLPTSNAPLDAVGSNEPTQATAETDAPGTYASWSTAPLSQPLDVVGIPVLHLSVSAPAAAVTSRAGNAGDLVLFAKIYDVAPDGTQSLIHGLVAPARIADPSQPVQITLPGIVHRFAPGHRLELVVAAGDIDYRGGLVPTPVTITTGSDRQTLDLPVTSTP